MERAFLWTQIKQRSIENPQRGLDLEGLILKGGSWRVDPEGWISRGTFGGADYNTPRVDWKYWRVRCENSPAYWGAAQVYTTIAESEPGPPQSETHLGTQNSQSGAKSTPPPQPPDGFVNPKSFRVLPLKQKHPETGAIISLLFVKLRSSSAGANARNNIPGGSPPSAFLPFYNAVPLLWANFQSRFHYVLYETPPVRIS